MLFNQYHTTETEYDILFGEIQVMYKDWLIWDVENCKNIGEYESMCEYLETHVPEAK
jgi:hypothetical protein